MQRTQSKLIKKGKYTEDYFLPVQTSQFAAKTITVC